jgi:dephospho-CoA kinase
MLKVGLTGGLASGKSEALKAFARCGAWTLSLDEAARELSGPGGPLHRSILRAFGRRVLGEGGLIDREALAALAFASPSALRRLEAATHPGILAEMRRRLRGCPGPVAVVDAPLLFEAGIEGEFDACVLVTAGPRVRLARAVARGMERSDALRRMRAQWPQARKERLADVILPNESSLAALAAAARELHQAFRLMTSNLGDP